MKQKFLMLLAVVLLSCVSAFAQSGNNEPLKGDVNEDGKVDVADIVAVINIMKNGGGTTDGKLYFSVGTTAPTASNYTTANNATTTIPTTKEFTNNSGSKAYVYILAPSNKTVTATDLAITSIVSPLIEDTSITIPNHKVYVTDGKIANGGGIKITITDAPVYYYYAGWTLPTVDNVNEIINEEYPAKSGSTVMHKAGKKTTSKSEMNYLNNTLYNGNAKINYYVLVPSGQTINDDEHTSALSAFASQGTITVGNQQHTIYKSNATSRNINAIIIE